ncbi:translation elongation factor 4, partial [Amylibacter sp.]|nr:translation elongation factor 4 [Amylibacter sp.]
EMYGKDLIESAILSSKICQTLGKKGPNGFAYEMFLDEKGEKISKSKGNGITINEWLKYASPESLFLYMYQNPKRAKKLYANVVPKAKDGKNYILNIIDTPGHVDFSYEVSRSLSACEGSILIVDSSQGVEAQTLANVYQALDNNHAIIPVLNKIDLPAADTKKVKKQIEDVIGIDTSRSINCSGKTGEGVDDILESIVTNLPFPKGNIDNSLKSLLIDSWYDSYLGVVILVRVIDGSLKKGMKIKMMSNNTQHTIEKVGVFTPKVQDVDKISSGEIGFIITGIKNLSDTKVGDTICDPLNPIDKPLPGFKPSNPVVFCGLFPVDNSEYQKLKDGLAKLKLNDSSFSYEPEASSALGLGFRCGFLGLLHLEIIIQRLEREFDITLITTTPGVIYKINKRDGSVQELQNPTDMPDPTQILSIEEPWIKATIITPDQYLGSIIKICQDKRGVQNNLTYSGNRAVLSYELPLNEVVFDFYDRLKSISSGYASFDYDIAEYKEGNLVKIGILVNTEPIDALSMIIHKDFSHSQGRLVCEKLKELIPRHNFQIPIQAAIGGKIIARETIKGYRKDVLTKIHGGGAGDRKRKLLDKQKKGKTRAKQFGKVEIPQEAFIGVLKINKET